MLDREGDKIVLEGEADQAPDQKPGDIIFGLVETEHAVFQRAGPHLSAHISVTLGEALCGFSRIVIKHLDGRGIHLRHPKTTPSVLKPGQVIKIANEGMPMKKSEHRGDLYLIVDVEFPDYNWLKQNNAFPRLHQILPKPAEEMTAEEVDDVDYDATATMDSFDGVKGQGEGDWEDEDADEAEAQCTQQ